MWTRYNAMASKPYHTINTIQYPTMVPYHTIPYHGAMWIVDAIQNFRKFNRRLSTIPTPKDF